jgi:undecaprenyl pyrophosphate synthase
MYNELDTFKFWAQKVLPLVYEESLSYYEVLCKLVEYINDMDENQLNFNERLEISENDISVLKGEVQFLTEEIEKVKNGDYVSLYLDSIENWINRNLQELVARIVKFVAFGLDDTGRLYCNIPETWDFLSFDTDVDPNSDNYGRLMLEW